MSKQEKVIKKIKENNIGNSCTLGTKNNDECYTSMQDILNELSYWAGLDKFNRKDIICPCDWDITDNENIYSINIIYKDTDVEIIANNVYRSVQSVQIKLWSDDEMSTITTIDLKEDEIEDFLRNKLTCNFVRTLTQNARRWGIKSITASGYNPANNKGIKFQDVDYSKYDICITNPPFSLYSEFMRTIIDKIDFICLAPAMNRANPNVGLPLMLNKCYLGVGRQLALYFNNPTKENNYNTKRVNCDWITSFHEAQDDVNNKHYTSGITYELYKDDFSIVDGITMLDGTHPLKINNRSYYPDDYDGWMFVPATILDFLDLSKYEWYGTVFNGYYSKNPSIRPFTKDSTLTQDNKKLFAGIVFRKKKR